MDKQGYPFYIRLNGHTSEVISIYGKYCRSIWLKYPYIEIEVIADWRPVGETVGAIAVDRRRKEIVEAARNRLSPSYDDWDEIPF